MIKCAYLCIRMNIFAEYISRDEIAGPRVYKHLKLLQHILLPIPNKTINYTQASTTFNSINMIDEKAYLQNSSFKLHFLGFH